MFTYQSYVVELPGEANIAVATTSALFHALHHLRHSGVVAHTTIHSCVFAETSCQEVANDLCDIRETEST